MDQLESHVLNFELVFLQTAEGTGCVYPFENISKDSTVDSSSSAVNKISDTEATPLLLTRRFHSKDPTGG